MGTGTITELFDGFDRALAKLCAGYNIPCTNDRRAAYREAFGKLHLAGWERLIDYCLTENGPEKFPTVKQLWGLRAQMKSRTIEAPQNQEADIPWDPWLVYANRLLLAYIRVKLGNDPKAWGPAASEQQCRATDIAVKWKNVFATFMAAVGAETAVKDRGELWESHMREAEKEIAA